MSNKMSWTKQFNIALFDLEDGRGVNLSTALSLSKYSGTLVLYEGIRFRFAKEGRVAETIGCGLSPEDMLKYRVRAVDRLTNKRVKKELITLR